MLENIRSDIRVCVIYYKLYINSQEITFDTQILTVTDFKVFIFIHIGDLNSFFLYNFLQLWLLTLYLLVLVCRVYIICPKWSEIHSKQS